MLRTRLYYSAKPFLPWKLRMALRRWHAKRILRRCGDVWPILESAGRKPDGWPGWPDGKQFALVLTHDVEGPEGLAKVQPLAELELKLGFRSCFNFIPEGPYSVPSALRSWLTDNGFEVGVHDLRHDGRLFSSRKAFQAGAPRINRHLKDWGAVGFRSGFMLHNLDWLHDLDIQYDASTFDTDPFEPQPEGRGTIFPFFVPRDEERKAKMEDRRSKLGAPPISDLRSPISHLRSPISHLRSPGRKGYIELPYTLPQDSTLFLLLRETTPDIWLRKLDWIAQHGGMALVNVHPDYLRFDGEASRAVTFPVEHYRQLLDHVRGRCSDNVWAALPREVAARSDAKRGPGTEESAIAQATRDSVSECGGSPPLFVSPDRSATPSNTPTPARPTRSAGPSSASPPRVRGKIWIDLDNTPHVPFFEPIIEELERRGYPLLVTARDAFQVIELAERRGLRCLKVGRHYGKHRLAKGYGLIYRALQMLPLVWRDRPVLAVSHGARSQLLVCNCLRIPSLLIEDYEHARFPWLTRPDWVLAPQAIPKDALPIPPDRVLNYPGLKEDVYAWKLRPDPRILSELGVQNGDLVVTVRPPATEAHYHNPESEALFDRFMDRVTAHPDTRVVLLPRNQAQGNFYRTHRPRWFEEGATRIPARALDGLNLLWHSDLVVSGGGTMNREAAALGVPVYSIFRGRMGAVDSFLESQGLLTLIRTPAEVHTRIRLERREKSLGLEQASPKTLSEVIRHIEAVLESR